MENSIMGVNMPAPGADIYDRIRYLIRLLRYTQAGFAKVLGVDAASVSRVVSGRQAPSDAFINRIVVNLGVSKKWLVEGADVPFPKEGSVKASHPAAANIYNVDVSAGTTPFSIMFTDEYVIGQISMPGINPELPIVRVSGDSMQPRLKPGCYISIRRLNPADAQFIWGRIYVVVLPDYRLVKYVMRNDNPDMITLHSENPNYDDVEVRRSDIQGLYLVENVINNDFLA